MSRFDECLTFVLTREGGFVNDPADPGGATNQGVTQAVYDQWRRDRSQAEQSVSSISPSEVAAIYHERYWTPARCAEMPKPIDLFHFDAAVNNGVGTANRMLQTCLNQNIIDGIIGPRTLANLAANDPNVLAGRYANQRITRYIVLSMTNPSLKKFLKGWLRRVGALLDAM